MIPDPEPISHVSVGGQSEKESNAVNAHHEYYGSTHITTQKVGHVVVAQTLRPCHSCMCMGLQCCDGVVMDIVAMHCFLIC